MDKTEINSIRIGNFEVDLFISENGSLGITVYEPGTGPDDELIGGVRDIFVTANADLTVTSL